MKKMNNQEEIELLEHKYGKLKKALKVILIFVLVLLIMFTISFVYRFSVLKKMFMVNTIADLGNNCKVTRFNENGINYKTIYFKDNVKKEVYIDEDGNENIYIVKEGGPYFINETDKTYELREPEELRDDWLESSLETSLVNYLVTNSSKEEKFLSNSIIKFLLKDTVIIEKDNYRDKECILILINENKFWLNPDTYYIEKEEFRDQIVEQFIECDVVTDEDVQVPDLTGYTLD